MYLVVRSPVCLREDTFSAKRSVEVLLHLPAPPRLLLLISVVHQRIGRPIIKQSARIVTWVSYHDARSKSWKTWNKVAFAGVLVLGNLNVEFRSVIVLE